MLELVNPASSRPERVDQGETRKVMVVRDQRSAQSGDIHEDVVRAMDRISEAGVTIQHGREVENHLLDHPYIYPVLPDTVDEAIERLGDGGQIILDLDCSAGLGNEYLVLLLRSRSYDASILDLSRDLTEHARARMPFPEHRFIVTTDFALLP
jgi:hypothetical protein